MRACRNLIIAGLLAGLSACAPPGGPGSPALEHALKAPPVVRSAPGAESLSGAQVENGPPIQIVYPAGTVYAPGAVLPSPEGLAHLEALAAWLQRQSLDGWQVTATPEEGNEMGRAVAAKRLELLKRFFKRKGLVIDTWEWQVVEDGGVLRLIRLSAAP